MVEPKSPPGGAPADDEALVAAARAASFASFEALVRRHQGRVFAVALGMLKRRDEAEEVTQETFLAAFENLKGFRGESGFATWVYRVAVNQCLMRLRRRRPEAAGDLSALDKRLGPDEAPTFSAPQLETSDDRVHDRRMLALVDDALQGLPDEDRAVLLLRVFDGLPNREIAALLDTTVPAVKSRLHRARLSLREALAREAGVER